MIMKLLRICGATAAIFGLMTLVQAQLTIVPLPYLDFVAQYGGDNTGLTDNAARLTSALTDTCGPSWTYTGHVSGRAKIILSPGKFRISSNVQVPTTCQGWSIAGQGSGATVIITSNHSGLQIGAFSVAPSVYYFGCQHYEISGLQIYDDSSQAPKSRQGSGIQDNGCGGAKIHDVKVFGFKYGFATPYGADLVDFDHFAAEQSDVGLYMGPGSQQFTVNGTLDFGTFYNDVEGVVCELCGKFRIQNANFINDGIAGTSDHSGSHATFVYPTAGETTRMGVTVLVSPFPIDAPHELISDWFEINAGGLGYQPACIICFQGTYTPDAARGLIIENAKIVGGYASGAFIGNSLTTLAIVSLVRGIHCECNFAEWFSNIGSVNFSDIHYVNGYAKFPLADATTVNLIDATATYAGAEPTSGYEPRGFIFRNATPTIATSKVLWGWIVLTDNTKSGAAWVDGTNVTPLYSTVN